MLKVKRIKDVLLRIVFFQDNNQDSLTESFDCIDKFQ